MKQIDHRKSTDQLMEMANKSPAPDVPAVSENDWITLLKDNSRTGGHSAPLLPSPAKARWQMRVGSSIRTAPVLRAGALYVTSTAGYLHAIQTDSGRLHVEIQGRRTDSFHTFVERGYGAVWMRRRESVRGEWRVRHKVMGDIDGRRSLGFACGAAGSGVLRERGRTHVCGGSPDGKEPLEAGNWAGGCIPRRLLRRRRSMWAAAMGMCTAWTRRRERFCGAR